jgi:hypothetical protein
MTTMTKAPLGRGERRNDGRKRDGGERDRAAQTDLRTARGATLKLTAVCRGDAIEAEMRLD